MGLKNRLYNTGRMLWLLAALVIALGPAIAPVLSTSSKTSYIEICTSFGLVKKAVTDDGYPVFPDEGEDHSSSRHCPFCHLRQFVMLPPQAFSVPMATGGVLYVSLLTEEEPDGLQPAFSYSSRAPPLFS